MKRQLNKKNLGKRILVSPFIFCIMLITYICFAWRRFKDYLYYGAEIVVLQENDKSSIENIYKLLKEQTKF